MKTTNAKVDYMHNHDAAEKTVNARHEKEEEEKERAEKEAKEGKLIEDKKESDAKEAKINVSVSDIVR